MRPIRAVAVLPTLFDPLGEVVDGEAKPAVARGFEQHILPLPALGMDMVAVTAEETGTAIARWGEGWVIHFRRNGEHQGFDGGLRRHHRAIAGYTVFIDRKNMLK